MKLFNKVAIIGTGLIGGSIALDIKQKKIANTIIGVSRHKKSLLLAKKNKVIDIGSLDLSIVKDADLIVLATPVSAIIKLAPLIKKYCKADCIVTDVGSTKYEIVNFLSRIFSKFIGSHPLAGSEKRGVANATKSLFKNSLCILTPGENTDKTALKKISQLWALLGARITFMSPSVHDQILASISHLPHVIAFSLINSVNTKNLKFAPNSLRDVTRIAASDSQLWSEIFLSNKKALLYSIKRFQSNLCQITSALEKNNKQKLIIILNRAKQKRTALK